MSDLPPGWEWARFGDVAEIASNLVNPLDHLDAPHIAPNHIEPWTGRILRYTSIADDKVTSSKHQFFPGQLLYSKIRPYLGKVASVDFGGLCSADMYPLNSHIDRQFLKWWILTPRFTESTLPCQGRSLLPKINAAALRNLPVPVAPLAEQRRIVATLEVHLSHLKVGTSTLASLAAKADVLQDQMIVAECLGSDSLSPLESEFRLTPADTNSEILPRLPDGWQWKRLGEIADVVGGITKDAKRQTEDGLREVRYLRVANVQSGYLDLSEVSTIRASEQKISDLTLRLGDVLLNEGGDRDKLARGWVWQEELPECIHQNHVFRARIQGDVLHPKILAWHANTFGKRWAQDHGKQSVNLASISLRMIRLMPVPIPPPMQQESIVATLVNNIAASERLKAAVEAGSRRAELLRRSLLTEAFAGRLVPQDPQDEPASVLLDRIRAQRTAQPNARRSRSRTR